MPANRPPAGRDAAPKTSAWRSTCSRASSSQATCRAWSAGRLPISALPATELDLELTEHTILRSDSRMLADLHVLRAQGVGIVLDHFGTGHASIAMLRDHPVTRIRIDRSLVSAIGRSPSGLAILDGVARLGQGFGLAITADGVETAEQARLLRPHCSEAQGAYFGQRVPAEEFGALHFSTCAASSSHIPGRPPGAPEWAASPRWTMGNSSPPRYRDPDAVPH